MGHDNVNHPEHYTSGGVECIDAIRAATGEHFAGFLQGNVVKYVWRYRLKGGSEDLKKARWYLNRLIHIEEEEERLQEALTSVIREIGTYVEAGKEDCGEKHKRPHYHASDRGKAKNVERMGRIHPERVCGPRRACRRNMREHRGW